MGQSPFTDNNINTENELIEHWNKTAVGYADIVKMAQTVFGRRFMRVTTSVPLISIPGPLNELGCRVIWDLIHEHCKSEDAANWFSGFVALYVGRMNTMTHTTFKLRTIEDGVHVKTTLFLAELVLSPDVLHSNSETTALLQTQNHDTVYFSCIAIEYTI
jgi:hypothetical protein